MRACAFVAGMALVIGTLAISGHARAQDEPYPIDLKVGETFDVCASGLIRCPTIGAMCDAPNVAIPVNVPEGSGGLGFRGVGPGTTLCSAASVSGFRRVFRVTVR